MMEAQEPGIIKEGALELYVQKSAEDNSSENWLTCHAVLRSSTLSLYRRVALANFLSSLGNTKLNDPNNKNIFAGDFLSSTHINLPKPGTRRCETEKRSGAVLGISIKGGTDYGCPVYISNVEQSSCLANLVFPGDVLVGISIGSGSHNIVCFESATHAQALDILRNVVRSALTTVAVQVNFSPEIYRDISSERLLSKAGGKDDPIASGTPRHSGMMKTILRVSLELCAVKTHAWNNRAVFQVCGQPGDDRVILLRPIIKSMSNPKLDLHTIQHWKNKIIAARDALVPPILCKPNPFPGFTGKVLRMGRVEDYPIGEKPLIMVATDHEVAFYNKVPTTSQDLKSPALAYPLEEIDFSVDKSLGLLEIRVSEQGCHRLDTGSTRTSAHWMSLFESRAIQIFMHKGKSKRFTGQLYQGRRVFVDVIWESGLHILAADDTTISARELYRVPFASLLRPERVQAFLKLCFYDDEGHEKELMISMEESDIDKFVRALTQSSKAHVHCHEYLSTVRL